MKVSADIFREYDVRGVAGVDLTNELALHLGKAVGTKVVRAGRDTLIVGRDCRVSGPAMSENFIAGVLSTGVKVTYLGEVPTPVVYWALKKRDVYGGVMITGSHNPGEYNGFKVTMGGASVHGDGVQELRHMIEAEDYANGSAKQENVDVLPDYIEDIVSKL